MWAIGILEETLGGGGINWLLWVALGFFGVMVMVGWLSSRKKKPDLESDQQPAEQHNDNH